MSVEFESKVEGMAGLIKALRALGTYSMPAMAFALHQEAEDIMRESAQNWVPVEWGTLRGTGFVEPPLIYGGNVRIRMHYGGGPAAQYAVIQHEKKFNHPRQGRDKYLEGPFMAAMPGLPARLAARFHIEGL